MPSIDLSRVTIVIPTFLRPGYFDACLSSILEKLPECKIAVACDDTLTPEPWPNKNIKFVRLPFDSGLTMKRNYAVQMVETEYTLLACDDFNFTDPETRRGIERMIHVLDAHKDIDVAVGTYNDRMYEGTFLHVLDEYIAERRICRHDQLGEWVRLGALKIEIGINYFLARTVVLRQVPWDENIRPIGGEHADWFLRMKDYGKAIVWVPNCPIRSFERNDSWAHPYYNRYRRRAHIGHKIFMEKWNIKRYIEFDEERWVETLNTISHACIILMEISRIIVTSRSMD